MASDVLGSPVDPVEPSVASTLTHLRPPHPRPFEQREQLADTTLALLREARGADPVRRQQLLNEVVTSHLWLADALARRFLHRGEDHDDLVQVARSGLVEAARRFDPDQGVFLAFAVPTISGVLKRHFRDHGWSVRPPRRTQELVSRMRQQWPSAVQNCAGTPNDRQLSDMLGETPAAVREARQASEGYRPTSIDTAQASGVCFVSDETDHDLDRLEARLVVSSALAQLDEEDRELLRLRFVDQRSQSDIAEVIGTSQMQVSRLLQRLLLRLRAIVGPLDGVLGQPV